MNGWGLEDLGPRDRACRRVPDRGRLAKVLSIAKRRVIDVGSVSLSRLWSQVSRSLQFFSKCGFWGPLLERLGEMSFFFVLLEGVCLIFFDGEAAGGRLMEMSDSRALFLKNFPCD